MKVRSRGRRGLLLVGALTLLLAPRPSSAQDTNALAVLERAAAHHAETSAFCADFSQHLSVPLLGDERSGRGRLCQARPDRFAMRFTDPAGDLVVMDGTWVWVYYPSLDPQQVMRFPVARSPGGFDLHREFLERPAEKYRATYEAREQVAGRAAHRIRLVPLAVTSYQAAVVWIDAADHTLRQVRVEEENGSVRTVTLTSLTLGSAAPAGWFTFTPPAGAQIIGG